MPTQLNKKTRTDAPHSVGGDLNQVHRMFSRLEKAFQISKTNGDSSFLTTALDALSEIIREISSNNTLAVSTRMEAMQKIQSIAADEEKRLEPTIPNKAPELWINRDDRDENPFAFAHRVYGAAAQHMLISDFDRLDQALGVMLKRYKRAKKHIPSDLYIQSKKERDADLSDNAPTWRELVMLFPPHQRRILRAYKATESRRGRQTRA